MPNFRFASRLMGVLNGTPQTDSSTTARFVVEKMAGKTIVSAGYSGDEPNIVSLDMTMSDGSSILFRTDERGTLVTYCAPSPLQRGIR